MILSDGSLLEPVLCASASYRDGGVRIKEVLMDPHKWDIMEVPDLDVNAIKTWFETNIGCKYDVIGLLSPLAPIQSDRTKFFCSESIMCALGCNEGWRFTPNAVVGVFEAMNGKWIIKDSKLIE
jgi:hypothetical protein